MNKLLAFFLVLLAPAAADAQTAVQWGSNSGSICIFDASASRPCVVTGALNSTAHTFTVAAGTLPVFTSLAAGAVPASGGSSTSLFLNQAGAFTAPPLTAAGTSGQLQTNSGGTLAGVTLGGDCTFSSPNVACTKLNGVSATLGGALSTGSTLSTTGAFSTGGAFTTGSTFSTTGAFSTGGALSTGSTLSTTGAFSTGGAFTTGGTFSTTGAFSTGGAFTTGGAVTYTGAYPITWTLTGSSAVTVPVSGTLATTANINTALPSATSTQVYVGTGAAGAAAALSTTGSGNAVLAGSPTITTPLISGVTSGANAAAGNIGEIISSSVVSGSAVSQPTSGTAINITSVALTAGDWDCQASAITNPAGTTTTSLFKAGMSGTSVTLPTPPAGGYAVNGYTSAAGVAQSMSLARTQYNASGSQTVYLVGNATFATSTMSLYGQISCRRVR